MQARLALFVEPLDPAMRALTRDPLGLRSVSNRPALATDALDQQEPAVKVQAGITVGHEDLRTVGDLDITHRTRGSSSRQRPSRDVTNLMAEYT